MHSLLKGPAMHLSAKTLVGVVFGVALISATHAEDSARPVEGRKVSFTLEYHITAKQGTQKVAVTALVPKSIDGRQKVLRLKYTPQPERVFEENGNKYAFLVLNQPQGNQVVTIDVDMELYRYDLSVAEGSARKRGSGGDANSKLWLTAEKFIEKDAKEVQEAAKKLNGKNEIETLRNIMRYVHQTVSYTGFDNEDRGALWALQNHRGDCTEFTDLFVALCRAKNIPARVWEGYLTDNAKPGDTQKHIRAEVYTRKYGWIPLDPLHIALGHATFENLKPAYIYLSATRNDPVLQNYHYAAYRYWGQPIEFQTGFKVKKQESLK